jgi:hypothetical protein
MEEYKCKFCKDGIVIASRSDAKRCVEGKIKGTHKK